MNAFRFLSLLTVGFSLLVFIFLLNATQGRMEAEAVRTIEGPTVTLSAGETVEWSLRLGGNRVEEAWPAAQRQPQLFLVAVEEGDLQGVKVAAQARYERLDGTSAVAWISGSPSYSATSGKENSKEASFGPLWMSWDLPLEIQVAVSAIEGDSAPASAKLVLRGEPSVDYIAARSMARTLWFVFTAIAAAGFAGLLATTLGQDPPSESVPAG